MPRRQALGVGDEQVVAHQLHPAAELGGQVGPAVPVLLGHAVLDRHDRVLVAQVDQVVGELDRAERAALAGQHVLAVAEELRRRGVERDRDVVAGHAAAALDRLQQQLHGRLVGLEVRGEAALVADRGGQATLVHDLLERVVGLGAPAQRLGERGRADRHEHELLHVDVVVGVLAAVDDVEHRHRQHTGVGPADVAVQRQVQLVGRGLGHRERHAEDGVGAEARLVVGAVDLAQHPVQVTLVGGVEAQDHVGDLAVDRVDGGLHALAQVALARRRRAARPPRRRPWRHPRAPRRDPVAPESSSTSTSTVGLPRESRISRPTMPSMMLMRTDSSHWCRRPRRRRNLPSASCQPRDARPNPAPSTGGLDRAPCIRGSTGSARRRPARRRAAGARRRRRTTRGGAEASPYQSTSTAFGWRSAAAAMRWFTRSCHGRDTLALTSSTSRSPDAVHHPVDVAVGEGAVGAGVHDQRARGSGPRRRTSRRRRCTELN